LIRLFRSYLILLFFLFLLFHTPVLSMELPNSEPITHKMMLLSLQLAVILLAAKIGGELFERFLKQPSVLGELVAGIIIGPHALGKINLPIFGQLFPIPEGSGFPISPELFGIATLASVILLFRTGLETDFKNFMRYSFAGTLVGIGGVVGSFFLGDWITVAFGFAPDFMHPTALFMGAISTATSVGITARVLSEKGKIDEPEGATIIAGAVIDDVLGIIVLAGVVSLSHRGAGGAFNSAAIDWGQLKWIALKATLFLVIASAIGFYLSGYLSRFINWFKGPGTSVAIGLGLALLLAELAEEVGLAMIIGAYIMGLSLARQRPTARMIETGLRGTYQILIPIFFCVMGMMVNLPSIKPAIGLAVAYSLLAIIGKILGGGLPSLLTGFNVTGAARIGMGMLPRGEVALIVAGVGLSSGIVSHSMFGVAILMTLVTTVVAPPLLLRLFQSGESGLRFYKRPTKPVKTVEESITGLSEAGRDFLASEILKVFAQRGYDSNIISFEKPVIWHISVDGDAVRMELYEDIIKFVFPYQYCDLITDVYATAVENAIMHMAKVDLCPLPDNNMKTET